MQGGSDQNGPTWSDHSLELADHRGLELCEKSAYSVNTALSVSGTLHSCSLKPNCLSFSELRGMKNNSSQMPVAGTCDQRVAWNPKTKN